MYQLAVREPKDCRWSLQNSVEKMKMRERLDARVKIAATEVSYPAPRPSTVSPTNTPTSPP